jgi:hypothetical protein
VRSSAKRAPPTSCDLSPGCSPGTIPGEQPRHCAHQTYRQIALRLGLGQSTVGRILKRAGLNRLAYLDPPKPANRYEYAAPGDQDTVLTRIGTIPRSVALAGSMCTSQSMTIVGLPSAPSMPTRKPNASNDYASDSDYGTCAPGRITHAPTARPGALSKPP